ncbi:MAG: hypothetical protein LBG59_08035 [Candidatus Peribacteria bacterium]|nr:hypothetical protein [Candidatus Peribacteria bacterium]
MDGTWQKIPIDNLGIDINKQAADLPAPSPVNNPANGFGQLRDGLVFSAAPENNDYIFFSYYDNPADEDIIRVGEGGKLRLPFADIAQMRELYVQGAP